MLAVHALENRFGDRVELLNLGARIRALELQTTVGRRNVVLSYATLDEYLSDRFFLGATVGRFANRIANASFELDAKTVLLASNEGNHQLHGGPVGFDRRIWNVARSGPGSITYSLISEDGDQGFPGKLFASVHFSWRDQRELSIRFHATTEQATPVNLTNHAYFNLDGTPESVAGHQLQVASSGWLQTDADRIPTGEIVPAATCSGDPEPQTVSTLLVDGGPDACHILNEREPAATLISSSGDLRMSVTTSYPGLQLYAGQYLATPFIPCAGLCLEAQFFPDSPNHAEFPDCVLRPGSAYDEWIRFTFDGPCLA